MEGIEIEKSNKIKPQFSNSFTRSSCFGCFGRFDCNRREPEGYRRSKKWWFPRWFKFSSKKKKGKTVPLDSLKIVERKIDCLVKFDGKEIGLFSDLNSQLKEKRRNVQNESDDKLDLLDCLKDDSNDNSNNKNLLIKSRSQITNSKNMNCSQQIIVTKKSNSSRISSSSSRTSTHHQSSSRQRSRRRNGLLAGKLEPVVGLSILLIVLVIMLLWGTLCAIFCASAWFYFMPSLRRIVNFNDDHQISKDGDLDLSSDVYKKKVILEGLLERSNRH